MFKRCAKCGKDFKVKPSHYDVKTYCSKQCMAEDYKDRWAGDRNPNYRGVADGKGLHRCPTCGKEFVSYSKTAKYCSRRCLALRPGNLDRLSDVGRIAARRKSEEHVPQPRKCKRCGSAVSTKYGRVCDACRIKSVHRKDANHDEIVLALQNIGAKVVDTHNVGQGFPDLMVIYQTTVYLLEIKNPIYRWHLTKAQKEWHSTWKGHAVIVDSIDHALHVVGAIE